MSGAFQGDPAAPGGRPPAAGGGSATREESFAHFLARECQTGLRWGMILSAAATIALMFTFFFFSIFPAMLMLACFVLLLIANYIEHRTHRPGDPGDEIAEEVRQRQEAALAADPEHIEREAVSAAVQARLRRIVIGIVGCVAVAAVLIAGFVFDRHLLFIGGMILFAYILLVAWPFWLGWLEEEVEAETHRVEDELHEER